MPTALSDRLKWIIYFKVYSDPISCLVHGAKKQDGIKFAFSCISHWCYGLRDISPCQGYSFASLSAQLPLFFDIEMMNKCRLLNLL